jgi:hypothetical protein
MKLKEKLAKEAVERRDIISNENREFYGEGFLEGFKKARELACISADSWDDIELRCMNDCKYKISNQLDSLGEEEVK